MFLILFYTIFSYYSDLEKIQIFYTSILFGSLLFIPGGIGATEGLFVTLLMDKNVEFSLASILIIFLRFVTIWALTGIGFVTAFRFILKLEHD